MLAAYFDHALEEGSEKWAETCRQWAEQMKVKFVSASAGNVLKYSSNVEAMSRKLRYRWLASLGKPGDTVLTAHHADDQAETFLSQMFRGGDFAQLAGIHSSRPILRGSEIRLARPLLDFCKQDLKDYACAKGLDWIEDPSNLRNDADRNFLRNRVMPALYARGSITSQRLAHASDCCRRIALGRAQRASETVDRLLDPQARGVVCEADPLNLSSIGFDDQDLVLELLRSWLHRSGRGSPTGKQLVCFFEQAASSSTGYAELSLKGEKIRYFDNKVYLTSSLEAALPGPGAVCWKKGIGNLLKVGIDVNWIQSDAGFNRKWMLPNNSLELAWHCGRKLINLPGTSSSSMIRKMQQSKRVPAWERRLIPCVLHHGNIVWVHGIGITAACGASLDRKSSRVVPEFVRASHASLNTA